MTATAIDTEALAASLAGRVLVPGDSDYDVERRVWNAMIDSRPAVIAQCKGVADVVAAVKFAREHDLPICVRGGGHSVDGKSMADDAFAVDLGPMDAVWVDVEGRRAIVQGGARWTAVDRETQLHGLATTGGTVSNTGVGGLTLGGGLGWLMRKHGTAVDNLLSIDVVTAAGEVTRASLDENPDLFWAMRGGGGNFGIATSFEFQLHPVGPEVLSGALMHPVARAGELLRFWRDFMNDAPDELASIATVIRAPELPMFPPELQGKVIAIIQLAYIGDIADGEKVVAPLREWGPPVADAVHVQSYVTVQTTPELMFPQTGTTAAARWYAKAGNLPTLTDEVIDIIVEHAQNSPVAVSGRPDLPIIGLWPLGGAVARTPVDAMAFTPGDSGYYWDSSVNWRDPAEDDRWIAWERGLGAALEPHNAEGVYLNFTSDEGDAQIHEAFGAKYERLAEAKRTWDPDNVLRFNKNIAPAGE